jgi:death-on-curing protein
MIDEKTAINIHNILIDKFGGTKGIRDINSLNSTLARPYATFDQRDLYPTEIEKAAALFESLIINHPFIDGNKRISYVLMRLTLMENNLDILATQEEKFKMVVPGSKGEFRLKEIINWIKHYLVKL